MTRLRFEMTGGYSGVFATQPLACDISVEDLPEADRRTLLDLVASSGLIDAPSAATAPAPRADMMTYRLTITRDGRTSAFTFDDATVPASVRPLLQTLQQRAVAQRAAQTAPRTIRRDRSG